VQNLQPRKVNITFDTLNAGIAFNVNGFAVTAPRTVVSWDAYVLNVTLATTQRDAEGQTQNFHAWTDGETSPARTIVTPSADVTYKALFIPNRRAGFGLTADYFDNVDLTGTRVRRVDPAIDWTWGENAPLPGIASETFSVRWTGTIAPGFSETYTFFTQTDDGVRLWINGVLVIDDWNDHAVKENSASVQLVAGRNYNLRVEYYDRSGGATARLLWLSPSQPKQIVPSARLAARKGRTTRTR